MRFVFPVLLIIVSGGGVALALSDPAWTDLLLLAGPCLVGGLLILVWTGLRGTKPKLRKWAILDGSNVMYWKDRTPHLDAVQDVIIHLEKRGYNVGVVFDANAGYLLAGRYQHDDKLALRLSIPEKNVLVVNKGEPADPRILSMARDMGAIVITNDRYRDWQADFPEIQTSGHLVRGGYGDAGLWLDLSEDQLRSNT